MAAPLSKFKELLSSTCELVYTVFEVDMLLEVSFVEMELLLFVFEVIEEETGDVSISVLHMYELVVS